MAKYLNTTILLIVMLLSGCQQKPNETVNSLNSKINNGTQDTFILDQELNILDDYFTFLISNDHGRNGYYDQKAIAEVMGEVAGGCDVEFVAALGDVHHWMGVQSVNDPLWLSNFEYIYKHPELMIPWYPILGNHEYRGNTDAVIAYSNVSRRWQMDERYYSKSFEVGDNSELLLVFIDTAPLIDKYRNSEDYPDVQKQSAEKQLKWIENTLKNSTAKWKIALGHHPIFAGTTKTDSERTDLQNRLKPILDKYDVDAYYCGHIHNFQHINVKGSSIDYFVNSSASLSREVVEFDGAAFSSSASGFALCSLNDSLLITSFIDKNGKVIYRHKRK